MLQFLAGCKNHKRRAIEFSLKILKNNMKLESFEDKFKLMMLGGFASILIYSFQFALPQAFSVLSIAIIIAGAALTVGGLLGFLFGIPRTLRNDRLAVTVVEPGKTDASHRTQLAEDYAANTNLEQISDWFTKILVGVGLTQIPTIRQEMANLIAYLQPGFGNSSSFTAALLVYFCVSGFITGYLWTRLNLIGELRRAEQQNLTDRVEKLEEQREKDANALALVSQQLNPGNPEIPQDQLDTVISAASPVAKVAIFGQAHTLRAENWRHLRDKPRMERTIPIFRALVKSDTENRFHRSHGELGFALKDKAEPSPQDLQEAISELTKAINIRGNWQEKRWTSYEFVRAWCKIRLHAEEPSEKDAILRDLAIAVQGDMLREKMLEEPMNQFVKTWIDQHINGFDKLASYPTNR